MNEYSLSFSTAKCFFVHVDWLEAIRGRYVQHLRSMTKRQFCLIRGAVANGHLYRIQKLKVKKKRSSLSPGGGRPSLPSLHSLSPVGATYAPLGVGSRLRVLYCVFSSCHCCIVLFDTL